MSRAMPKPKLTVVAPRGYPWAFNGPRRSRHDLRIRSYVPLNRLRSNLDGLTVFSPLDTMGADLIHAFNRVPLGTKRFVIGFESHLPRVWGLSGSSYERLLYKVLLSPRCRRIVGISHYAAGNFRSSVAQAPIGPDAQEDLLRKLEIRYPNLDVASVSPERSPLSGQLVTTFVGGHFARKGGCVVVRMAELAQRRRLPIHFNIVSSLQIGGAIWSDPSRESFFAPYLALLDLPNVTHWPGLPNDQVKALLQRSHIGLLPTFADTFGFSVLEAMASGTPVLATAQAALPEVITHDIDGLLLDPARTPGQPGWIWPYDKRDEPAFEQLFTNEVERLAEAGLKHLEALLDDPARHEAMSIAAHQKMLRLFSSDAAERYWDDLYADCLAAGASATREGARLRRGAGSK